MNIQELILNITTPIITTILIAILSKIFFIEPLKRHKEIKSKIIKLKNNFIDTNNSNKYDSMTIRIIESQVDSFKEILELIDETIENNKIFAFLFGYKKSRTYISLLFEYNRNSIMLQENKIFENDYRMDKCLIFKKIKNIIDFQKRVLMIAICLFILAFVVYYFYSVGHK